MNPQRDELDQVKRIVKQTMNQELPADLQRRMEQSMVAFRQNLSDHPAVKARERKQQQGWFGGVIFAKLAWTTVGAFVMTVLFSFFLFGNSSPTWAEVARHFQSIPFFHATVYFKANTFAQPFQFEIWRGEGGKIRLRFDKQIIFADQAGIQCAFDVIRRKLVEADSEAVEIVQILNSAETFSLETVIRCFAGDIADLRPVPNRVEGVSHDLSIFDLTNEQNAEWIRIWTLQESLLPILLKKWDPEGGESVEVVFSYLDQQPESFFDAEAFREVFRDPKKDEMDLIFAFFKDPGGLPMKPGDIVIK